MIKTNKSYLDLLKEGGQRQISNVLDLARKVGLVKEEQLEDISMQELTQFLVDDRVLWMEFKRELKDSRVATNGATKAVLVKFVAKRMNDIIQSQEIKIHHEMEYLSKKASKDEDAALKIKELSQARRRLSFCNKNNGNDDPSASLRCKFQSFVDLQSLEKDAIKESLDSTCNMPRVASNPNDLSAGIEF